MVQIVKQFDAVSRTAINLSGVPAADVRRGDVIVEQGHWVHTNVIDVEIQLADKSGIRNGKGFSAHIGSARRDVSLRPVGGERHASRNWFSHEIRRIAPFAPR